MQKTKQMSESLRLGIILALSGGFMDAYSYICRGGVFANAQTGNILLIGFNFSKGNWKTAATHLAPVIAFIIGIALSDIVRAITVDKSKLHWRQITILFEAFILFIVSFFSQDMNLLANSLTSFACGIQVESFRKIHGNGMATTMCIGNLRTATQSICEYYFTKNKCAFKKGLLFYGIIIFFVIGAIIGSFCVEKWQESAIRVCSIFLIIGFIIMFSNGEKATQFN